MAVNLCSGQRSSDLAERQIIQFISSGEFPAGGELPPERQLAIQLGVGRPTLREALQRLERDGWITQRLGRPALVNDFWQKGNLYTLVHLVQTHENVPENFILHLLELRAVLAPAYIRLAVEKNPSKVVALLVDWATLPDNDVTFAEFDWELQKKTALLSANPLYVFLLNSFDPVYIPLATRYFREPNHRRFSKEFYRKLLETAMNSDSQGAEEIVREAMLESITLWQEGG